MGKWEKLRGKRIRCGYILIHLLRIGEDTHKLLSRLILEEFIGPCPEDMECAHNNGDTSDNRLENLRWATHEENIADMKRHGTVRRGVQNPNSTLTETVIPEIRARRASGESCRGLAREYGVSHGTISKICRNQIWVHI